MKLTIRLTDPEERLLRKMKSGYTFSEFVRKLIHEEAQRLGHAGKPSIRSFCQETRMGRPRNRNVSDTL